MGLPASVRALQRALLCQPDLTDRFEFAPFQPLDLFTDGSCLNPTCAYTRVAGWGLVAADPADMTQWWPVAQGLVPGHRQTSVRAEITAAISALRYVLRTGHPVRVWIDNSLVVSTLAQALQDPDKCRYSNKDKDLWHIVVTLARTTNRSLMTVHKVASHQKSAGADLVEQWAFRGNDCADHSAGWSARCSAEFAHLWHQANADIDAARILRDQVHLTMLQVSEAAVKMEAPDPPEDSSVAAYPLPLTEVTMGVLPQRPQTSTHKLVGDSWNTLMQWSASLVADLAPVVFVPWLYLYIDFVLHTNSGGARPANRYKQWHWMSRSEAAALDLFLRTKWFRLLLLQVYKLEGVQLSSQYVRPSTRATTFWAHCVSCRMKVTRLKGVEDFMLQFKAAFTQGRDLELIAL